MQYIMIAVGEKTSHRFELLCEYLDMSSHEQQEKVWGALTTWYCHWASDLQLDCGLFWDLHQKRFGMWAGWPDALRFGNALVKARYVRPVEEIYPVKLRRQRSGFVALAADGQSQLDVSWLGVHRDRRGGPLNARELCLYLLDPKKRIHAARSLGWKPEEVPDRWLDPALLAEDKAQPVAATGYTRGQPVFSPSPPPTLRNVQNVNVREANAKQRNVRTYRTGKPKTPEMKETVRANRYENPLLALRTMDDGATAEQTWQDILREDPQFVHTVLAELTETVATWDALDNPASVVMKRCRVRLSQLGIRYGRHVQTMTTAPRGGGGDSA